MTPTSPGGDNYLTRNVDGSGGVIKSYSELLGINAAVNFPSTGYAGRGKPFQGYTQGPGYWGKTFFIWPPDPTYDANNVPWDWRKRYFTNSPGNAPLNDNTCASTIVRGAAGFVKE